MTNLMNAEWTKIRSVRSTMWSFLTLAGLSLGMTTLATSVFMAHWNRLSPVDLHNVTTDSVGLMLQPPILLAQIVIAVLAVLVISSEFSSRTITTTMLAVPTRRPAIVAKLGVLLVAVVVITEVIAFASFFVGQAIVSQHVGVSLSQPGVLRAVLSYGAYLGLVAMFAFGIGLTVRNLAGSITVAVIGLLVLPNVANLVPGAAGEHIAALMPASNAAQGVLSTSHDWGVVSPFVALAAFAGWAILSVVVGAALMSRRDV